MSKLDLLGATVLSLTMAIATPSFAQMGRGAHGGGGVHVGGGGGMAVGGGAAFRGAQASHVGGGMPVGGSPAFRGAQASIGPGPAPAATGGSFAGRTAQFTQNGYRGYRAHDGRFRPGFGFAAGLAAGSALGSGYYDPYYYDDYAYSDYYDDTYPVYPGYVVSSGLDPAYCAQRYRSYDPASGTYLGYDGLRHPCP